MLSFSAAPLEAIQQTLAAVAKASAQDSGKNPQPVTLIAVSKTQPRAVVDQAMAAGVMVFGENRVQEAQQKFSAMHPRPQLHLIGPLQTNKVGAACALFDYIHTLDRPSLIMALAKEKQKCGKIPQLLIQVNVGRELQKAGVLPEHFPALWQLAQNHQLPVVGLMCIPPHHQPPRPFFKQLAEMARRHNLPHLSMGMSDDWQDAVAEGATFIRLGTAVFGPRLSPSK